MSYVTVSGGEGGGSYDVWVDDEVPPPTNPQVPQPTTPVSPADVAPDPPPEQPIAGYPTEQVLAAVATAQDTPPTNTTGYATTDPSSFRYDSKSGLTWGVNGDGTPMTEAQFTARAAEVAARDAKAAADYQAWQKANAIPDKDLPPLPEGVSQEEVDKYIKWLVDQNALVGGGTIGGTLAGQGISDPYHKAVIVQQAIDQIQRAKGREELGASNTNTFTVAGVTFTINNKLDPWNDSGYNTWKDSNPEAYSIANKMKDDPAFARAFAAENGWDKATSDFWQLKVLDPKAAAAISAKYDRENGIVAGPYTTTGGSSGTGALVGPNPVTSNPTTRTSTTTVSTVAINPTSTAYSAVATTAQTALNTFVRANPSNLVRRRTGQKLLTPTQDAARTTTIDKLNSTVQTLDGDALAASTPVFVGGLIKTSTGGNGFVKDTNVSASLPTKVNYLNDASLTNQTELQLIPIIGAAAIATFAITNDAEGPYPPDIIPPGPPQRLPPIDFEETGFVPPDIIPPGPPQYIPPVDITTGTPTGSQSTYISSYDPITQSWGVWDNTTGTFVQTGLTQGESNADAVSQNLSAQQGPTSTDNPVANAGGSPKRDGQNFTEILNPDTGKYDVWNLDTGKIVVSGLDETAAEALSKDLAVRGIALTTDDPVVFIPDTPAGVAFVTAYDPETDSYGVWDQRTGSFIQTGLSKDSADVLTAETIDHDPAGGQLNSDSAVVDTVGTPTEGEKYVSAYDPETESWGVLDNKTGTFVKTGLSEAEANISAFEEQSQLDAELVIDQQPDPAVTTGYGGERYVAVESDENGGWGVFDNETGQFVSTGLSESDARISAFEEQSLANAQEEGPGTISTDGSQDLIAGTPADQAGGRYIVTEDGDGTFAVYDNKTGSYVSRGLSEAEALDQAAAINADDAQNVQGENNGGEDPNATNKQSTLAEAQKQATLQAQQKFTDNGDWRVKLSLAPGSDYLYNATQGAAGQGTAGILQPLQETGGVIFPYTPQIDTNYKAEYDQVALTHSNYKSYFYKSSSVEAVNLQATFTAQDTQEANYLLAVIHFFRSVTKMFYGQDNVRGTPPPLVYLTGLGEYQFNGHACVVTNFAYNLPKDVDYIRTRGININGADLLSKRSRQSAATDTVSSAAGRLKNLFSSQGITKGAQGSWTPSPPTLGLNQPTYVPTKMDMNITLLPIQSRAQVSQQFSVKDYANGNLLRGGFW